MNLTPPSRGFTLLPVIAIIAIVAAATYTVTRGTSLEMHNTSTMMERHQLEYAAEAGMADLRWHLNRQNCVGYAEHSGTLADATYTATATPANSSPVSVQVEASMPDGRLTMLARSGLRVYESRGSLRTQPSPPYAKDTYIKGNPSSASSFGTETSLLASDNHHTLVQFDVSSLPAGAHILSADLQLDLHTFGVPGTLNAYMLTRDWNENATWKWNDGWYNWTKQGGDVKPNAIGHASPTGPGTVSLDVTTAVEAWQNNTLPNHGILISGSQSGSYPHGFHSSRSSSNNKPALHITYGCECKPPGSGQSVSLQPGPATSADASLHSATPDTNLANAITLSVAHDGTETTRTGLLHFDLSAIPTNASITSAKLQLHATSVLQGASITAHPVSSEWTTSEVTWNNASTATAWTTPGSDFDPTAGPTVTVATPGTHTWEMTEIVSGWLGVGNHGLTLRATSTANMNFASSEDAVTANRPILNISYECACGICPEPPADQILMIVGDPDNLTPEQATRKLLLESWDYDVQFITTAATQAEIETTGASVGIVYIPELDTTAMNELGTKADNVAGGLITEEARRAIKLGSFSLFPFVTTDRIEIVDNSHHITQTMPLGTVVLSNTSQSMWVLQGTLAEHLQVLGTFSGQPGLAIVEQNTLRNDWTLAPGRRVKLPWGAYEFDMNQLSADGTTILQRALEWATDAPAPVPPIANILFVMSSETAPAANELALEALLKSMEFNVTRIDEAASQSEFDTALLDSESVLVTAAVNASTVANKLTHTDTGVVSSDPELLPALEIANSSASATTRDINVISNTHYITSPFSTGVLTVLDTSDGLHRTTGGSASGAQALAGQSGSFHLLSIDQGAQLLDGSPAPGRRVHLPWGDSDFHPERLSADGISILKRALVWTADSSLQGPTTVGYDTVFADSQREVENIQIAMPVVLSSPGTVTTVAAYAGGGNRDMRFAMYTDNNGAPGTLIAETGKIRTSNSMAWIIEDFPATHLDAGTYWLSIAFWAWQHRYHYEIGGELHYRNHNAASLGYLTNWGTSDAVHARNMSAYLIYNPD